MTRHMPECYLSGPSSLCPMCESLRACEQRVVENVRKAISWVQDMDEVLDVIVALREWLDLLLLPPSVGVPSTPMWPLRGES